MSGEIRLARAALHMWEEPCISGVNGSGAVFFSGCPLRCVYCQNHSIALGNIGKAVTLDRLVDIFFELKEKVAANFNTAKADAILEKAGVDSAQNTITEETNVLVLCAGGGTSGLLANALNKAAEEYKVPVKAAAGGYGAHREMLPEFDLVILAPQVASNFEDMKAETDKLGIKLAKTEGAQYIKLTRDGKGALAFVQAQFEE